MNTSVVIPVYNQSHMTERCLQSLLNHSKSVQQVTVIDNASTDGTAKVLEDFVPFFENQHIQYTVIHNPKNLGFGRACDQGIRISNGQYCAIVNNDTWLSPNWDAALAVQLEKRNLDCLTPYFYEGAFTTEQQMIELARHFTDRNQNKFRKHFAAILMFWKRSSMKSVTFPHGGIFDDRFFVTYEDTDLKERMRLAGLSYGQVADSFIWHHSRGSRNVVGALPSNYELEGLRIFMEIWGFDPRPRENTIFCKWRRAWWKYLDKKGLF